MFKQYSKLWILNFLILTIILFFLLAVTFFSIMASFGNIYGTFSDTYNSIRTPMYLFLILSSVTALIICIFGFSGKKLFSLIMLLSAALGYVIMIISLYTAKNSEYSMSVVYYIYIILAGLLFIIVFNVIKFIIKFIKKL